jgi:CRP/FNR family transcriptional regulator
MKQVPPAITDVLAKGTIRSVPKNSVIFYQGEVPQSAALIKRGVVKVYNLSPDGEEQLASFHVAGEFFPSTWMFGQTTSTIYFYETFTDCEICFVPRRDLMSIINKNAENVKFFMEAYVKNYTGMLLRVTALQQAKANAKISYTLFYLSQRYGKVMSQNTSKINIQLTHQQFASLVGLTRETTATEMKKLEKQGIVRYDNQVYKVNTKKLLESMGDESFTDIKLV